MSASNPSWCPQTNTYLGSSGNVNCTSGPSTACVTFTNYAQETVDIVGGWSNTGACGTAAYQQTITFTATTPSFWTVRGASSGIVYLDQQQADADLTFLVAPNFPHVNLTAHGTVPWEAATLGTAAATLIVYAVASYKDNRARRIWCSTFPDSCEAISIRNPQNGRLSYKGFPQGMPRTAKLVPVLILAVLTALLALGWAASRGAFGFYTADADTCRANGTGWVFSGKQDNFFFTALARATGLGICTNSLLQQDCYLLNQRINSAKDNIYWDQDRANSLNENIYTCACVDPVTKTTYNCSTGDCSACNTN